MAYTKTTWINDIPGVQEGTPIDADNMNKIENGIESLDNEKAPLDSPEFTGTPKAPTASAGTNTTQIATTAFVTAGLNLKANLASPAFTGNPTSPTPATADNDTSIATTAYVRAQTIRGAGVSVTNASWIASGNAEYPFKKNAAITGVVAADYPTMIAFTAATIAIANAAGIGYVECYAGGVTLFAKSMPSGTVTFDYVITKA